jgi:hypothetical protein
MRQIQTRNRRQANALPGFGNWCSLLLFFISFPLVNSKGKKKNRKELLKTRKPEILADTAGAKIHGGWRAPSSTANGEE